MAFDTEDARGPAHEGRGAASGGAPAELSRRLARAPLASSVGRPGWEADGVAVVRRLEPPTEVLLPPLADHVLMVHVAGATTLARGDHPGRMRARRFGAGQVNLLSAGRASAWRWDGRPECAQVYLPPRLVDRVAAAGLDLDPGRVEFVDCHAEADPLAAQLGSALLAELEGGGLAGPLFVDTLAQALVLHILRTRAVWPSAAARRGAARAGTPGRAGLSRARLAAVIDYVDAHLAEPLRLADLARTAGYAEAHFAQAFRIATGTSPHRYVLARRVERAKALLRTTAAPLTEVAFRTGFATQAHFTAVFRRHTGTTPGRYRAAVEG